MYNGNIAETYWRTASDNVRRKYSYTYDGLNRMLSAYYQKPDASVSVTNSYNESATYDKNSNIVSMQRTGEYDDSFATLLIDNLVYSYDPLKQNQLMKVKDNTNNPNGFKDDSDGTNDDNDDYRYDDNGNMIKDDNKRITKIDYNHLNLPVRITFGTEQFITYLYDAQGQKLQKFVQANDFGDPDGLTTDYLGGFQYEKGRLQFFPTAEGFVKSTYVAGVNEYNYIFNYKDHLGNVRVSYG